MSDEGFTRSYRRKWQHPVFRNLRDAGIWAWMIDTAAWRPTKTRFAGRLVELQRGQLVTSERFIADGFCVSRIVVTRLLDELVQNSMIVRQQGHGGTIISICNYEKYQSAPEADSPSESPGTGQQQATDRPNKKEEKEVKESKKESSAVVWEGNHGRRLTKRDWDSWRSTCSRLSEADFRRELMRADGHYGADEKRWFFRFSSWLARADEDAERALAAKPKPARINALTPEGKAALKAIYDCE